MPWTEKCGSAQKLQDYLWNLRYRKQTQRRGVANVIRGSALVTSRLDFSFDRLSCKLKKSGTSKCSIWYFRSRNRILAFTGGRSIFRAQSNLCICTKDFFVFLFFVISGAEFLAYRSRTLVGLKFVMAVFLWKQFFSLRCVDPIDAIFFFQYSLFISYASFRYWMTTKIILVHWIH